MKHNIMHGLHVEWLFDLSVGAQQNQRPGIQKQHDVPFEGELHPWLIRFWWRFGLLGITLMICSSQISSRWRGRIIVSGLNQGTIVIIRIGVHDKVRVGLFVFVPASWNERPTWRKAGGKTLNTQGFQHTCLHCAKISTSRTLSSQTIFQCAADKCWVRNKGKTPVGEPARAIGFSECRASLHWPDTFQIWNWDHKMTTHSILTIEKRVENATWGPRCVESEDSMPRHRRLPNVPWVLAVMNLLQDTLLAFWCA